jgi:hypothetical protein
MHRIRADGLLIVVLMGPGAVFASALALWENEGRFDYYRAAQETTVVATPQDAAPDEPVSLTGALDTTIPIMGEYVGRFTGYLVVRRFAEVYSWRESEDDDGYATWDLGWHSTVESNSRNSGIVQRLSGGSLYPPKYQVDEMEVSVERIHLVDLFASIPVDRLPLSDSGTRLGLERSSGHLYLRQSPNASSAGDERLSYTGVKAEPQATYFGVIEEGVGVGKQFELRESFISALIQNDGILHHLVNGDRDEALATVRLDFVFTKWLVRVVGTLGMIVGFGLLFRRFASLLYRFRSLRGLVRVGVFALGLAVGLPLALAVMASSMVIHSPLAAAVPMALAVGGSERSEGGPGEIDSVAAIEDTFSTLAALALVEGGLDPKEQKFLTKWGRRKGIEEVRMAELLSDAQEGAPEATSRENLELLVYMALVDGVLSARESSVLEGLGKKLGISPAELMDIVTDLESAPSPMT